MKKIYLLLLVSLLVGCEIKINECIYNEKAVAINYPCRPNSVEKTRILEQIKIKECTSDCFSWCFEEVIKNENNCNYPGI